MLTWQFVQPSTVFLKVKILNSIINTLKTEGFQYSYTHHLEELE